MYYRYHFTPLISWSSHCRHGFSLASLASGLTFEVFFVKPSCFGYTAWLSALASSKVSNAGEEVLHCRSHRGCTSDGPNRKQVLRSERLSGKWGMVSARGGGVCRRSSDDVFYLTGMRDWFVKSMIGFWMGEVGEKGICAGRIYDRAGGRFVSKTPVVIRIVISSDVL